MSAGIATIATTFLHQRRADQVHRGEAEAGPAGGRRGADHVGAGRAEQVLHVDDHRTAIQPSAAPMPAARASTPIRVRSAPPGAGARHREHEQEHRRDDVRRGPAT